MPAEQNLLPFGPVRNVGLFSNHWLANRLRNEPEWGNLARQAQRTLEQLTRLWQREERRVEGPYRPARRGCRETRETRAADSGPSKRASRGCFSGVFFLWRPVWAGVSRPQDFVPGRSFFAPAPTNQDVPVPLPRSRADSMVFCACSHKSGCPRSAPTFPRGFDDSRDIFQDRCVLLDVVPRLSRSLLGHESLPFACRAVSAVPLLRFNSSSLARISSSLRSGGQL